MIPSADAFVFFALFLLAVLQKASGTFLPPAAKSTIVVIGGLLSAGFLVKTDPLFEGLFAVAFLTILVEISSPKICKGHTVVWALLAAFGILKHGTIWEMGLGFVLLTALLFESQPPQSRTSFSNSTNRKSVAFTVSVLGDTTLLLGFLLQAQGSTWATLKAALLLTGVFLKLILSSLVRTPNLALSFLRSAVLPVVALDVLFRTAPHIVLPQEYISLVGLAEVGVVLCPVIALSRRSLPQALDLLFQGATAFILLMFCTGAVDLAKTAAFALLFLRSTAAMLSDLIVQIMSGGTDIKNMGGLASVAPKTSVLFVAMGIFTALFPLNCLLSLEGYASINYAYLSMTFFLFEICVSTVLVHLFKKIFIGECRADEFVIAYMKEPPVAALLATSIGLLETGWIVWKSFTAVTPSVCGLGLAGVCIGGILERYVVLKPLKLPLRWPALFKRHIPQINLKLPHFHFVQRFEQFFFEKFYSGKTSAIVLTALTLFSGALYVAVLKKAFA